MNILETIQNNDMLKVILILVAVYLFINYYNKETLENTYVPKLATPSQDSNQLLNIIDANDHQEHVDKIVAGKTALKTDDLLPKYDDANEFAKENPVSKLLKEQNFLQAGHHHGINTVVQSNRIKYHDLRSAIPIPKTSTGPWQQSSYEQPAGANRRYLEIN